MEWYTGNKTYDSLLFVGFLVFLLIMAGQRFGAAAYGRFGGSKPGLNFGPRTGWILMEIPALILFPFFFLSGSHWHQPVPLFLAAVWMFHYTNRALVTPLLMRVAPAMQPTFHYSVVMLGWVVIALHSYLNGVFISEYGQHLHNSAWFQDGRFIVGLAVYAVGFTLNLCSDTILRQLRTKSPSTEEPRYKVPYGGAFRWISCPQYLGEIISFLGLAIMTWSLGFVYVLLVTAANLIPRALQTHSWYQSRFANYPAERKAILPFFL